MSSELLRTWLRYKRIRRGKGGRKEEEEEKVEAWAMTDLSSEMGCGAGLEHEAAAGSVAMYSSSQ